MMGALKHTLQLATVTCVSRVTSRVVETWPNRS